MVDFNLNGAGKPSGGGGALFAREDNLRSDARLAARMIANGVVTLDRAEELLRDGMNLAGDCAQAKDPRGYSACMKIAIEVAKLAQAERHKFLDKTIPDQHQHSMTGASVSELLTEPEYIEFLRGRESYSLPSPVCTNGHQGNGKPLGDGPSRNGH
jgi:hypothetical protein